jgi:hypothetical protein
MSNLRRYSVKEDIIERMAALGYPLSVLEKLI